MFNGKNKAITFSYDDGVTQDKRLIEIFNKYGLRSTFNLNSELLGKARSLTYSGVTVDHIKVKPEDVKHIYDGHEVAVHTLTHPNLTEIPDDEEVIRQVEQDRLSLSELAGYEVFGMAYPCGGVNCNDRVADIIRNNTPIKYARTITTTKCFEPYTDLYQYKGTVSSFGEWEDMLRLGREFIELETDTPQVLYIWGHSYEFDLKPERWEMFDEFCRMISGKPDIFYGTNIEILTKKA